MIAIKSAMFTLTSIGLLFALVPATHAEDITIPHASEPLVLAQSSFCYQQGMKPEASFETPNFYIYICYDNGNNLYYYGFGKDGSASGAIGAFVSDSGSYVAQRGIYSYVVNSASLQIYEGGTLIQQEPVF